MARARPIDILRNNPVTASFEPGELQIGNKDWGTPFKGQLGDLRLYQRRLYANEALEIGLLKPSAYGA